MIYLILLGVFACGTLGAWASFTDRVRESSWYVPLLTACSVGTGALFALGCRIVAEKPKIFVFSLYYDVTMGAAYYLLPVLFFGCRVNIKTGIGAILILLGLTLAHNRGD